MHVLTCSSHALHCIASVAWARAYKTTHLFFFIHVSKQATHLACQLYFPAEHSGNLHAPRKHSDLACCLPTMETRNDHRSDVSEPILVSTQDPSQAPLAPIVAPTAFASGPGPSLDAGFASTLALVPHQASNSARTAPYSARTPPPRPVFSTTQHGRSFPSNSQHARLDSHLGKQPAPAQHAAPHDDF